MGWTILETTEQSGISSTGTREVDNQSRSI